MQLSLNKATTKELIQIYFLEKLNEQVHNCIYATFVTFVLE